MKDAVVLIFANKQDLPGALSLQQISDRLEIPTIQATGRHCAIFSSSAWEAPETINQGFDWVVADIGKRVYVLE
jgi:signal recognition particle receptor subunit beta